jgi:hypothetical protein
MNMISGFLKTIHSYSTMKFYIQKIKLNLLLHNVEI